MKIKQEDLKKTSKYKLLSSFKSIDLPNAIEISNESSKDFLQVIEEIISSAYGPIEADPSDRLEIIEFSPFYPDQAINPLIIDSSGISFFLNYWNNRKVEEIASAKMKALFILENASLIEIIGRPIDWVPEDYFGVLNEGTIEISINLDVLEMLKEVIEKKLPKEKVKEIVNDNEITTGNFSIDLRNCLMKYKENKIDINPETQSIKFLIILFKHNGSIRYREIANELNIIGYREGVSNSDISRSIHFIKKDLIKKFKLLGMQPIIAKKIIRTIPKLGYKINKELLTK